MNTPLYHALRDLAEKDHLRMHMPGHKGKAAEALFSVMAIDYTEITPTGNLYTGEGPIAQAEALAARAYGAEHACFLTGGSTQGILAGMALCAKPGDTVLIDRNTHKSFFHAMALLDLKPVYLKRPEAALVAQLLAQHEEIKTVCVTSPTYYGVIADIEGIACICREHGAKLLVDEAHGAHFPFVGMGACAAGRGAAVSVCSAHKTLPALGGSAILFADGTFSPAQMREKTALFGTSSPSYPIMASIDWARGYLEGEGCAAYRRAAKDVCALRTEINARGIFHALCEEDGVKLDPTRLTVDTARGGLSGARAGALLETWGIYPEMANRECVVFIITCNDTREELQTLGTALRRLEEYATQEHPLPCPALPESERCTTIREAVFGEKRYLPLREGQGCISAASVAPYPPGVPVIAPGERITREILDYLRAIDYDLEETVAVLAEGACGHE